MARVQLKHTERPSELKRTRDARPAAAERSRRGSASEPARTTQGSAAWAAADRQVLNAFRRFLMAPGQMLCFASNDLATMRESLGRLTAAGMLVAEKFPGAYSLTAAGFAMMGSDD